MRGSASIVVKRPPPDVWAIVADVERLGDWMRGIRAPRRISPGELAVGSGFECAYGERGARFTFEVTELVPLRRRVIRATDGPFALTASIDLTPEGRFETRVTSVAAAGRESLLATALGGVMRRRMARDLSAELRSLRELVERG